MQREGPLRQPRHREGSERPLRCGVEAAQLAQLLQRWRAVHLIAEHGVADETQLPGRQAGMACLQVDWAAGHRHGALRAGRGLEAGWGRAGGGRGAAHLCAQLVSATRVQAECHLRRGQVAWAGDRGRWQEQVAASHLGDDQRRSHGRLRIALTAASATTAATAAEIAPPYLHAPHAQHLALAPRPACHSRAP